MAELTHYRVMAISSIPEILFIKEFNNQSKCGMKRSVMCFVILFILIVRPQRAKAQDPITLIIKEGITKVIKAVDLKIQRLQTKIIWLQNAQKVIENTMSKLKLDEITGWVEKQRALYKDYFEELQKVKLVLTYYHKVKEIAALQLALANEYKQSFDGIRQDTHFTPDEVSYMGSVYSGIIDESLKNLEGLYLVINSFATQMSDEKRMEIIDGVQKSIQKNYNDLRRFSIQNIQLSIARAKDQNEILMVKNLYGLQ
jgi:flagellin-specific chaperone FliS